MEHHLRPLLIITILALLLAGAGYMLWPQKSSVPAPVVDQTQYVSKLPAGADAATYVAIFDENGPVGAPVESEAAFEPIGKDKNNVYFGSTTLTNADPKTFVYISAPKSLWFKDNNHVYFYARRDDQMIEVDSINPSEFQCIGDCTYAKDRATVWYGLQAVNEADPATFTLLNRPDLFDGAQDKNHIFAQGQVVEKTTSDGAVLKPLGFNNLYSDGQRILQGNMVVSSDAAHFSRVQIPQSQFLCAKDSVSFYLCSNQSTEIHAIEGSDPATFEVIKTSDGQDSLYAKDKNLVYWFGEPDGYPSPNVTVVQNADSVTFQLVSDQPAYDAQDKNHKYLQGQAVQ